MKFEDCYLEFGDYILFQEYIFENNKYRISKPILAIFLGYFVADQAIGFNYVKWCNDKHKVCIKNKIGYCFSNEQVEKIDFHIEWINYVDILEHWKNKPNWKNILLAYRKQNKDVIE